MPLDKSCSLDAFKANVRASYKDGKTAKGTQHVAIALSTLKRACGVKDGGKRMSPKEIVAAGQKDESAKVSVSALIAQATEPGDDVFTDAWVARMRDLAEAAYQEAVRRERGPATERLLSWLHGYIVRRPAPTFEAKNRGSRWGPWVEWLSRLEMAATNQAVFELGKAVREYRLGEIAEPSNEPKRSSSELLATIFGEGQGKRSIDLAVRTSPRGVGTSPSAAPPDANNRTNNGTFRAYADGGKIKSGDGRAPKGRSR